MSIAGFDPNQAAYDRNNRLNKPEFSPGMDQSFASNTEDIFSSSTMPNNGTAVGQAFNTGAMPGMTPGMPGVMPGMNPGMPGGVPGASPNGFNGGMQQQQGMSDEDKFWGVVSAGGKGIFGFMSDFVNSFKQLTPTWWYKYFFKIIIISGVVAAVGFVGGLFGWKSGFYTAAGAFISLAGGLVGYYALGNAARKNPNQLYKDSGTPTGQPGFDPNAQMGMGMDMMGGAPQPDFSDTPMDMGFPDSSAEGEGEDEGDDDWADIFETEDTPAEPQVSQGVPVDEALKNMNNMTPGMWTRQYLYSKFVEVLPTMMPSFCVFKEVQEDSDKFLKWDSALAEAATVSGCKEENIPSIMAISENYFTIKVTCNRPQGAKMDVIGEEFCKILIHDEEEPNITDKAFVKVDTVGSSCYFSIFTAKSAMVSLKDMMLKVQDRILDTKNMIPVVIGIDQVGTVILTDMRKLESVIITGMPRSGKSWLVQSVLTQMCAFLAPSELNIYICDPKEGISDFKRFCLPHVKDFVTTDGGTVETLRRLVKVEGERRRKMIGDAGYVNIWDFKKANPSVKLPLIYVVIDEVVTLSTRMDKEVKAEFMGYLRELISQLPALGIRAIIIPHILNNDIIEKKTSDLVLFRASVKGDADHIEKATGAKPRAFPYKLVNTGDMAIRLSDGDSSHPDVLFVHGACLTESNDDNNKLFDYLRQVWAILDKGETGVLAQEAEQRKATDTAVASTEPVEEVDLFGSDDDDIWA